ncbi:MAG: hypothetical protein DMG97_12025 [Acidobacteria bacterium]|nr:MAG: hypothetical protein DMG97_12025 [Acidobacteriota bacterium]
MAYRAADLKASNTELRFRIQANHSASLPKTTSLVRGFNFREFIVGLRKHSSHAAFVQRYA